MSPERWKRVQEIFDAAVERSSGADEFARAQCGGDERLYLDVRDMLQAHRRTAVLDHPPVAVRTGSSPVFSDGQIVAGRYRILRYLSHGGMGEVYEAEDLDLPEMKEHVALKTLLPEIASDRSMVARFKQEIALSRKIQHPNVCGAFDLSRHEVEGSIPILFLTMPFLPGETLADRLGDGRMNAEEALPLLVQMAEALDAAHAARVIHRDFKPSNVMLVPAAEGVRAVVTDFGLARRIATSADSTYSLSETVVGTLDYMAPELLTGSMASVASDVYALGMVAYKMVTGTRPFAAETPLGGAIRRSKQPVPWPRKSVPDLDPKWGRAILQALDASPAARFSSAGHFLQALRGEAAAVTVRLPVMTRRRVVSAGLAAVLVAGAAVAWRGWSEARNRPSAEAMALYRTGVDDIHAGAYFAATKALGEAVKRAPGYALAHARLADAWVGLEMTERASREMEFARREDNSGLPKIDRLEIDAVGFTTTREFPDAVAKYEEMVKLAGGEDPGLFVDLGRAYEGDGKPRKAIESYQRAAEGPAHNPAAWLRLAVLYSRPSNVAKSEAAFHEAEELYQQTSNLEGMIEVAEQRGVALNERGQLDQAAAYLHKAFDTARSAGNIQQEIRATLNLSTNAYLALDSALAEGYAHEALETARANEMGSLAIRGLITVGSAHKLKRDYAGAEKYYLDALHLAQSHNASNLAARSSLLLASLHDQLNRSEDAAREARDALAFYQPNRFTQESFGCLTILGRCQRRRGDYAGSLDSFQALLKMAEGVGDRSQMALAHEAEGGVYFAEEEYPKALEQYQKNLGLSTDPEKDGYAAFHCANTYWQLGYYSEAASMFAKAEVGSAKIPALALNVISARAEMEFSRNRYSEAAKIVSHAMATESWPAMAAVLKRILGLVQIASGNKSLGLRNCEEALAASKNIQDVENLLSSWLAVLRARIETGDRNGAMAVFHDAEPALANHPESDWRALALISKVDTRYFSRARAALNQLESLWGSDAFQNYCKRPDIKELSRRFLQLNAAQIKTRR